jgi:membrane associated rhomboid family serine protease
LIPLKDENPARLFPFAALLLVAANVAVFAYQVSLGPAVGAFVTRFGAVPWEITHPVGLPGLPAPHPFPFPAPLTLVTSMFLHGGFLHLAGNMLYLWIFGDNIESLVGHGRFLLFYLLCGLAAAAVHVAAEPASRIPMVGASGAISGVLGAYWVSYPGARVHMAVFLFVMRVPALIVLGAWFALQVASGLGYFGSGAAENVAWFAHIGGFIAGIVFILLFPKKRRRRRTAWF